MTLRTRANPLFRTWCVCTGHALLLVLSSGTAAAQAPAQRPASVARPSTSTAPTAPTVARPTAAPVAKPTTPPARATPPAVTPTKPTTPAAKPTVPASKPTIPATRPIAPAPRPAARPPADVGPPPSLPDLGPPPSLPPTDAPVMSPEPTTPTSTPTGPAKPTGPAPAKPTGPAPLRPTVTAPARPTVAAPPVVRPNPPPTASPAPASTVPIAPPPVSPDIPPVSSDIPGVPAPATAPAVGDPALRAPSIAGAEPTDEAAEARPQMTPDDLEKLEKQRAQAERKNPKKWRHGGLIVDFQLGTAGCFRQFCRSDTGHDASPGVHIGGFFGGNVLGILEIGLEAGWNTLRPQGVAGRNAVTLYGLDPALLQQQIAEQMGLITLDVDFSTLVVSSAKSRALNIGPSLRIHFIRKGRGLAYFGTGIHYQLWRNRYETAGGDLRLDFHGLSAPFKLGGGAYVHPNIAVVGEFTYALGFYFLGGVNHPDLSAVAPLAILESTAVDAGASLKQGLPHFGKFSVNLRFRF